ncbi:hypothetical protein BT96DRAFT_984223 [Gymnopus androsaceus JB14]|uniref:Carbohydrate esterase family 16 protein n=1 Tax=Gymnopus androsaceus JB14 TaxID=1447944 RepID=A0A6A4IL71_9AGAR|nr:hypothetical protein BT96DRAFT_984223 [Gymnopus androsaceus JB14]
MTRFATTLSVIAHLWTISAPAARASSTGLLTSRQTTSAQVHLAVTPNCGNFSGSPADVNQGLKPLSSYATIVAFGDSYTSGGTFNGSALAPAVLSPPNPNAGGRITNGPLWVENLASAADATLQDWSVNGSVVDSNLYSTIRFEGQPDYLTQEIFGGPEALATTVVSDIIFGILELNSNPTFAKNFLIVDNYGRGTQSAEGEAYKEALFSALYALSKEGLNIGFVDFKTVWDGVLNGSPGYQEFGYSDDGACLSSDLTMDGECDAPDTTFYWVPGTPSAATHSIMAEYVEEVLTQCVA